MPTKEELLTEQRKQMEAQNAEAEKRMNATQPTPTQAEIDSAKLGSIDLAELDSKEDHGAPEEKAVEATGSGTYKTRASTAKKA